MPQVCPQPGPRHPGRDCPLYDRRLAAQQDSQLRRAILVERRTVSDLTALIRAENGQPALPKPTAPPTRPALPAPDPLTQLLHVQKGIHS